ncbi:hypothetical protein [Novosphingobium acidiphilum]|nr:hypothetical protein [Novosphingobium acidiphilum]
MADRLGSTVRVSNKELLDRFMVEALNDFDLPDEFEELEAA